MLETKRLEINARIIVEGQQEGSADFDEQVQKAISFALNQHVKLALNTSPENRGSSEITRIFVNHTLV